MTRFSAGVARYVALACLWSLATTTHVLANDDFWAAAVSGVWQNGVNWVDGSAPESGDVAFVNLPGAYTVSFNGTPFPIQALTVTGAANTTFTSASILNLSTLQVTSPSGSQDVIVTDNATLTLGTSGGIFNPDRPLHLTVGNDLDVQNGATLNVRFGSDATTHRLNVASGGQVNVIGSGSALTNDTFLTVGTSVSGVAAMTIQNGGTVFNNVSYVGGSAESTGTVTVTGTDSTWANSGWIVVGAGIGQMSVQDGGSVTSTTGTLGWTVGSNGTVGVSGAGSTWTMSDFLRVGESGTGQLTISAGGSVSNVLGVLGLNSGSSGAATVTGAGSTWSTSGELTIGNAGAGTLIIESGGEVSNTDGYIGRQASSAGMVNVAGTESTWTNSGNVHVGYGLNSTGNTLSIGDGGSVSNNAAFIATSIGSSGTATVTGIGSTWANEQLIVGNLGHGTLLVENGGHVSSNFSGIASGSGSSLSVGDAIVTGTGSVWNANGTFVIGGLGMATLSIEADGQVATNQSGIIGSGASSTGIVTVTGIGSAWSISGSLDVGSSGRGTLNIQNGAAVSNMHASIARNAGSNGNVTVSGAGSTWSNSGRLGVGGNVVVGAAGGTGTLNIGPGGTVNANIDVVVFPQGLVQLQGGTLDTPAVSFQGGGGQFQWTSGTLHVGTFSGSLLNQGGKLAPGHSAGTTTIVGNYTQQFAARLEIEIGGAAAFDTDIVNVTGQASLGGELQLALINSFEPGAGQVFSVMQAGGLSGAFSNVANGQRLVTNGGAGSFVVNYGPESAFPNQVRLTDFQPSPTGLVAYEPFDYSPAGADLLGANGGSGFAGPWAAGGDVSVNYDIGADSLSFAELSTTGNRVTTDALASSTGGMVRELSVPLGAPGTTSYLSVIIRPEDTLHQGLFGGFLGIYLNASTGDELFVGKPGGGALDEWVLEDLGGAQQHASGVDAVVEEEFLLVVRADFSDGNDVFTLYVNPTPGGAEPQTGTVKNDSDVGTVRSLWFWASGAFSIDELRIGTSYADVVPLAGLPGDYNQNNVVDAADYVLWRNGGPLANEVDNAGVVNAQDYTEWRARFGQTTGGGTASSIESVQVAVPEPTTLMLVAGVISILLVGERRRILSAHSPNAA